MVFQGKLYSNTGEAKKNWKYILTVLAILNTGELTKKILDENLFKTNTIFPPKRVPGVNLNLKL